LPGRVTHARDGHSPGARRQRGRHPPARPRIVPAAGRGGRRDRDYRRAHRLARDSVAALRRPSHGSADAGRRHRARDRRRPDRELAAGAPGRPRRSQNPPQGLTGRGDRAAARVIVNFSFDDNSTVTRLLMNRCVPGKKLLPLLVIAALVAPVSGQQAKPQKSGKVTEADLANAKPGRDPNQPLDEDYTKGIKKYTTETFFNSPLTDYLPAAKGIPTPKAILGDVAGAEGKLPYSKEVYDYMRLLARSTPRVKVFTIGTTEEGREMIAVAVASEALMAKLDANKADLAKLADPRSINF